jgi:hypothetical protein
MRVGVKDKGFQGVKGKTIRVPHQDQEFGLVASQLRVGLGRVGVVLAFLLVYAMAIGISSMPAPEQQFEAFLNTITSLFLRMASFLGSSMTHVII